MHGDPRSTGTDGVTYIINADGVCVFAKNEHVSRLSFIARTCKSATAPIDVERPPQLVEKTSGSEWLRRDGSAREWVYDVRLQKLVYDH